MCPHPVFLLQLLWQWRIMRREGRRYQRDEEEDGKEIVLGKRVKESEQVGPKGRFYVKYVYVQKYEN